MKKKTWRRIKRNEENGMMKIRNKEKGMKKTKNKLEEE